MVLVVWSVVSYNHNMFWEHQDVHDLRWSILLCGHLNASKIYVKEIIGAVDTIRCRDTLGKLPSCCK